MDVASNFVDTETTRDVATLVGLFPQLVCPTFFDTLVYPIKLRRSQGMHVRECTNLTYRLGGTETPAPVDICLTDLVASVTTAVILGG